MNDLERALVDKLVKAYKDKGVHVQAILQNPLFMRMPLEAKIKAIEEYAEELTAKATFNSGKVTKSAIAGGLGTAAALYMNLKFGNKVIDPAKLAAMGVVGGALSGMASSAHQLVSMNRTNDLSRTLKYNSSLDGLVSESIRAPISANPATNLIDTVFEKLKLHSVNHLTSEANPL